MAAKRFRGDYPNVNQVKLLTPANVGIGDIFTVTINGKAIAFTADAATVANVTAGLVALLSVSSIPEFAEITWEDITTAIQATAETAGESFDVTLTTTDGNASNTQTFTESDPTANTGRGDWNQAANWSSSGVPGNGDEGFLDLSSVRIRNGLAQSAVTLDELHLMQSFAGELGRPYLNEEAGEDENSYYEYRDVYLAIGATLVNVGYGEGVGSGRLMLNTGTAQTAINVFNTGSPAEQGMPSFIWKGTHASNVLEVLRGLVGVCIFPGETGQLATLRVGYVNSPEADAIVTCGAGLVVATIDQAGGILTTDSAITTKTQTAGEHIALSGNITTLNLWGGTMRYRGAGTLATVKIGTGGFLDFSQDLSARSITNVVEMSKGSKLLDPHTTVTFGVGIKLMGCKLEDVTIDIGNNRVVIIS